MTKIGVIGLGNMGYEMASNLSKNNYEVFGFDNNREILNIKEYYNLSLFRMLKLITFVDVLITMLPDGKNKDV